jgi:hypothetical protein
MAYIYGSEVKLGTATAVAFSPEYSAFWRYFIATKETSSTVLRGMHNPHLGIQNTPGWGIDISSSTAGKITRR